MYHSAFNKKWFAKHQKLILKALNLPIIKYIFRHIWRIETKGEVTYLDTHAVWYIEDGKYKTEFRTHDRYSKRMYYSLKPIWWLMHTWDLFADTFLPKLSFGFDSLTAYCDADPETSTVDGKAYYYNSSGASWATVIAGAGADAADSNTTFELVYVQSDDTSDLWRRNLRGFALFDTSSIGTNKIIDAATLSFLGDSKADTSSFAPNVNVYSSNPTDNTAIVAADYELVGSTAFSTAISYADFDDADYNDFIFNEDGLAAIDPEGISKFSTRNVTYDVEEATPSWASSAYAYLKVFSADYDGENSSPKLVVTYSDALFAPFPSHFLP